MTRRPKSKPLPKSSCEFCRAVRAFIQMIPQGLVSSYGDVAKGIGYPGYARQVAYCLRIVDSKHQNIPWHRVVRGTMRVAFPRGSTTAQRQLDLLKREGALDQDNWRIPPERRWRPGR